MTQYFTADAEQAKETGGMIALYPSQADAQKLVLPGGEPLEDLHLTLLYFGQDVTDFASLGAQTALDEETPWLGSFQARVFGHATFNPDGEDPCAVYLIGNAPGLQEFQHTLTAQLQHEYGLRDQHTPWVPHVTAGYGKAAADLTFTGDITFDRVCLKWAGEAYEWSLPAR